MHVVCLVAFAVFNAGCVCWLNNQQSMAVVEIVATRTVFASCGSSMAAGKIEQLVGNGSCRFED